MLCIEKLVDFQQEKEEESTKRIYMDHRTSSVLRVLASDSVSSDSNLARKSAFSFSRCCRNGAEQARNTDSRNDAAAIFEYYYHSYNNDLQKCCT